VLKILRVLAHRGARADEWLVEAADGRFDASDTMLGHLMIRTSQFGAEAAPAALLAQRTNRLPARIFRGSN